MTAKIFFPESIDRLHEKIQSMEIELSQDCLRLLVSRTQQHFPYNSVTHPRTWLLLS